MKMNVKMEDEQEDGRCCSRFVPRSRLVSGEDELRRAGSKLHSQSTAATDADVPLEDRTPAESPRLAVHRNAGTCDAF